MNRQQLAERMTHYVPLTLGQATDAIRAFEHAVVESTAQGEAVAINGFGLFEIIAKPDGVKALCFRQALALKAELNQEKKPGLKKPINQAAT